MTQERFTYLLQAYADGNISDEEEHELSKLINTDQYDNQIVEMMNNAWEKIKAPNDNTDTGTQERERVFSGIKAAIEQHGRVRSIGAKQGKLRFFIAAASVSIVLVATIFISSRRGKPKQELPTATDQVKTTKEFLPGTDKALLTLADGATIALDSNAQKTLRQDAITIERGGRFIKYDQPSKVSVNAYNTLSTPRGGQYQLMLPDGTNVWLNTASSLRYPTAFIGKERIVELTGEAYFEIAKDASRPFKVKVNNSTVQAIGTHFNIMGYADETATRTTLTEGRIKVSNEKGERTLSPGQQMVESNSNGEISIAYPDIDKVLAWRSGFFEFDEVDIATLMRQIGRWYNIEIKYDKLDQNRSYGGRIRKDIPLSKMVKMLDGNGLSCKLEDHSLTITNK